MSIIDALKPQNINSQLRRLTRKLDHGLENPVSSQARKKLCIALIATTVCLLILHYLKYSSNFVIVLRWLGETFTDSSSSYIRMLKESGWFELSKQFWWLFWHILCYVLIPVFIIKRIFKEKLCDYGSRWQATTPYLIWYIVLAAPIVCFAYLASFRPDFAAHYPFYNLAQRSWLDFFLWELVYITQFICLEFFFRGFVLHAAQPALGVNSIFVMMVPYTMIHFTKPWLEATGAILFGLFLGILALLSRSIWGGALVHITIAMAMDIFALYQTGRLPTQLIW